MKANCLSYKFLAVGFLILSFPVFAAEPPPPPPPPPVIVIDPGHGGKDPGAISKSKIREKDVVLAISKKLAQSLKKRLGAKIFFTRAGDQFVTLDYRNRFANQRRCDLFLSIHANASPNKKAEGLEIYYLNRATDTASERLAARENAGAPKREEEIEAILSDLIQAAVTEESAELSQQVRKSLRRRLLKKYGIKDIEVKTALFYVLVGAKCPSLLIETGFITNPKEGKRLKSAAFQKGLADAIAEGVAGYLAELERPKGDL
jgi:N-acetylmuramoyl-L-alanine amidase